MTTFQDATVQGLKTLIDLWNKGDTFKNCPGGGCFWMAGNLFHTAVDSMSRAGLKDSYTVGNETRSIGQDALDYFNGIITDSTNPRNWRTEYGFWVDDYAWWGIAFTRAYLSSDKLGYDSSMKDAFALNAKNSWEALNASWDNTTFSWRKDGNDYSIIGGIPNTTNPGTLAGRNCVTNEGYWVLSSLLGSNFDRQHYLDPNANANDFFLQALKQERAPKKSILFDDSGLVYERFWGMPNTDYPDWTWLGDQGQFAGACYLNQQGEGGVFDLTQAQTTIKAVQTNKNAASGVLHEDLAPYSEFQLDYACGKGTFMRYLAYVNDSFHNKPVVPPYDSYITLNAKAVWKNQSNEGYFPYYWAAELPEPTPTSWGYGQTTANAVLHAAGLSAIIAALPWMADQPINQ